MSTTSGALGSDAWLGADEYEPGEELHTRATAFLSTVKWDALAAVASQRNNDVPCQFVGTFSVGHFNMTRRLDFEDGTSWVARVRFPTDGAAEAQEALASSKIMEIELASMKFFGSKTSIPVPKVHAYCLSAENEAGAPFILMDYIHGSVASELSEAKDSSVGMFGTPEQDQKFREQMAQIQATVASFRFSQIGGLYYNEEADDFYIGADLLTGKGPWTSATDYYNDLTNHLLRSVSDTHLRERTSFLVPTVLNFLMRGCGEEKEGPFRLTNLDFGAHNILVNENFDIVGVIDFDGVMAAPIEVVAQYPVLSYLDLEPPGIVDPRPAVVERVARTIPKLQTYKSMLARFEQSNDSGLLKISDRMGSMSASIYQGMRAYLQHQDFVNDKWIQSCLTMLQQQTQRREQN